MDHLINTEPGDDPVVFMPAENQGVQILESSNFNNFSVEIDQLIGMGFDRQESVNALNMAHGDRGLATEFLLNSESNQGTFHCYWLLEPNLELFDNVEPSDNEVILPPSSNDSIEDSDESYQME